MKIRSSVIDYPERGSPPWISKDTVNTPSPSLPPATLLYQREKDLLPGSTPMSCVLLPFQHGSK